MVSEDDDLSLLKSMTRTALALCCGVPDISIEASLGKRSAGTLVCATVVSNPVREGYLARARQGDQSVDGATIYHRTCCVHD